MTEAEPRTPASPVDPLAAAWAVLGLLVIAMIISYTDRVMLNLLVAPIRADLGLSETRISMLQGAAYGIPYACSIVPLAWISDRLSRSFVLVGGMFVWSVATIACAVAASYPQLVIARAFVGIGEAALAPSAVALISDLFCARRRGVALSVFFTASAIGPGLGSTAGGALLSATASGLNSLPAYLGTLPAWRSSLILAGLPGLVVAVLLAVALTAARKATRAGKLGNKVAGARHAEGQSGELAASAIRTKPPVLTLTWAYIAYACVLVADWAQLSWLPTFLVRTHGMSNSQAGYTFGAMSIIAGLIAPTLGIGVGNRLARTQGVRGILLAPLSLLVAGIPGCLMLLVPSLALLGGLLLGLSVLSAAISVQPGLLDLVPEDRRASALSLLYLLSGIVGSGFAPTLVALCTQYLYRDEGAVGLSIVTVALPALAIAICSFYVATRFLAHAKTSYRMLPP